MKRTSRVILLAFFFFCISSIPTFAGAMPSSVGTSPQVQLSDDLFATLDCINDETLATVEGDGAMVGAPDETQVVLTPTNTPNVYTVLESDGSVVVLYNSNYSGAYAIVLTNPRVGTAYISGVGHNTGPGK